jgi:hypothetical protein
MNEINNTFSATELRQLKALVNEEFKFIGGPEVPDFLVTDSFVIGTSNSAVVVSAGMQDASISDRIEDFSCLMVEDADADLVAETLKSGNMFLLNRRNGITGFSIVRERLTHSERGEVSWRLISDVALVIHLVVGCVVLRMVSHSVEAIAAEYVNEFSINSFEKPSSRFENDLFDTYSSTFELIDVE